MSDSVIIEIRGQELAFELGQLYDFVQKIGARERTFRGKLISKGEGRARHELTLELADGKHRTLSERDLINVVGPLTN